MFVDDHWGGRPVRVWSGARPPARWGLPESLTHGVVLPFRASAARAAVRVRSWRETLATTGPGADLARVLETRPDGPVDRADGSTACSAEATTTSVPLWANTLIDSLQARQSLMAHLQARQQADLAELSGCYPGLHEFLATEIALALGIAEGTATRQLAEAVDLTTRLPETFAALDEGRITPVKASTIRSHTQDLDLDQSALVEADVLPAAPRGTVPELRHAVQRAVIRHDPHGADDRHQAQRERRGSVSRPSPTGWAACGCCPPRRTSPPSKPAWSPWVTRPPPRTTVAPPTPAGSMPWSTCAPRSLTRGNGGARPCPPGSAAARTSR